MLMERYQSVYACFVLFLLFCFANFTRLISYRLRLTSILLSLVCTSGCDLRAVWKDIKVRSKSQIFHINVFRKPVLIIGPHFRERRSVFEQHEHLRQIQRYVPKVSFNGHVIGIALLLFILYFWHLLNVFPV
jgi:hypothetical protein